MSPALNLGGRGRWRWTAGPVLVVVIFAELRAAEQLRQWQPTPARPYVLRGADRRLLDRAERFLVDEQWDDTIAALMRLLEADSPSVVAVDERLFVGLSEYCHRLLGQLPPEPLARYRSLVDTAAEATYRRGIADRDAAGLQRVADKYFWSQWGDDALFALGELALQRGDYQSARNAWLALLNSHDETDQRLVYRDADLSAADVSSRLILVSIRAGDWQRAEGDLTELRQVFPDARGRLGGRDVEYAEYLAKLLQQARQRSITASSNQWPTFAGNLQRTNASRTPPSIGPYELMWSQPLANEQLSVFPIVASGLVIYQDEASVQARQLADGQQEFRVEGNAFRSSARPSRQLGRPSFSLAATDRFIYGVTNASLGPRNDSESTDAKSSFWSLDLHRDGAVGLIRTSEEPGVAFVGAPVVEGSQVFVPIRSNDQTARAGVACYDLGTGERRWQRWLCRANTPATGWVNEMVTNLLTYDTGIIYASTNLGAIAALRAEDGGVLWLRTYQRRDAELCSLDECAYYRGPSPCMYHLGAIVALPCDGKALLCFDAATGAELWQVAIEDVMGQLVGVTDDCVAVIDNGLKIFDRHSGQLIGENDTGSVSGWPALRIRGPHAEIILKRGGMISSFDVSDADTIYDGVFLAETDGANLALASDYLIAAGRNQLSVFRYQDRDSNASIDSPISLSE